MISGMRIAPVAFLFGLILLLVLLIDGGVSVKPSWVRHTLTALSLLLLLVGVIDRWAWRLPFLQPWLVTRPVLIGTWKAELVPDPEDDSSGSASVEAFMVVAQTLSTLSMRLLTAESSSELIADSITRGKDGRFRVVGAYVNEPRLQLRGRSSEIHNGAFILDVHGEPPHAMDGHYWTDRRTRGTLRLKGRVDKRYASFDDAQSVLGAAGTADD